VLIARKTIITGYGKVFGNHQGNNNALVICIAWFYRNLASNDFQEKSIFLVLELSYPVDVLRRYFHAYYKGKSGMEMVCQLSRYFAFKKFQVYNNDKIKNNSIYKTFQKIEIKAYFDF